MRIGLILFFCPKWLPSPVHYLPHILLRWESKALASCTYIHANFLMQKIENMKIFEQTFTLIECFYFILSYFRKKLCNKFYKFILGVSLGKLGSNGCILAVVRSKGNEPLLPFICCLNSPALNATAHTSHCDLNFGCMIY